MDPYNHVLHSPVRQLLEEYPVPQTLCSTYKNKGDKGYQQLNTIKVMFMASYFSEVIDKPSLISRFNGRFELLVPNDLNSKKNPDKYQEDVRRIKKFYFGDETISRQNLERYIAVSL